MMLGKLKLNTFPSFTSPLTRALHTASIISNDVFETYSQSMRSSDEARSVESNLVYIPAISGNRVHMSHPHFQHSKLKLL